MSSKGTGRVRVGDGSGGQTSTGPAGTPSGGSGDVAAYAARFAGHGSSLGGMGPLANMQVNSPTVSGVNTKAINSNISPNTLLHGHVAGGSVPAHPAVFAHGAMMGLPLGMVPTQGSHGMYTQLQPGANVPGTTAGAVAGSPTKNCGSGTAPNPAANPASVATAGAPVTPTSATIPVLPGVSVSSDPGSESTSKPRLPPKVVHVNLPSVSELSSPAAGPTGQPTAPAGATLSNEATTANGSGSGSGNGSGNGSTSDSSGTPAGAEAASRGPPGSVLRATTYLAEAALDPRRVPLAWNMPWVSQTNAHLGLLAAGEALGGPGIVPGMPGAVANPMGILMAGGVGGPSGWPPHGGAFPMGMMMGPGSMAQAMAQAALAAGDGSALGAGLGTRQPKSGKGRAAGAGRGRKKKTSNKRTAKRARVRLQSTQLEKLESMFANNQYPSQKECLDTAKELNLPKHSITIWFQNRRAKYKRMLRKQQSASIPATFSKQPNQYSQPGYSECVRKRRRSQSHDSASSSPPAKVSKPL